MGEVYRARDSRLGRDVAIKVLPAALASDAERLHRFEQEARAAAALNHSHILAVYDIGSHEQQPYIVSELLEGETLRARLESGPLPPRKAMDYAVQIAHGLAAAHGKGIVHRDLKPENVFLDTTGHVKVLDFGLAKLTEPQSAMIGATALPTQPPGTQPGIVLGTIGYMSPEQVRGQPADHRSDIFALGAVIYEMVSGRCAFRRETPIDTMTAILKEDPPELPVGVTRIPPALVRIVDRCLEKNVARRFQSADDLAFALEALTSPSGEARVVADDAGSPIRRGRVAWTVAALFGVIALAGSGIAAWLYLNRAPADVRTLRYAIFPPEGWRLSLETRPGAPTPIVIAPDGRSVAFVARRADGPNTIWIQPLDALTSHPLAETEGVSSVFWSPDSRNLGFFAAGKLKRVDAAGGPPTTVCDAPGAAGGSWSRDGVIVFNAGVGSGLKRVAASGGVSTDATTLAGGEVAQFRPWLLPDGRHLLYTSLVPRTPGNFGLPIYLGSLDSTDRVRIGESTATNVMFSQGHLLFMRDATLMAQPVDLGRGATSGEAFPVADGIQTQGAEPHQGVFSVSQSGVLMYQTAEAPTALQPLAWVSRAGTQLSTVADPAAYTEVTLSPDEKRALVSISMADLWTIDLTRGLRTRFTFDQQTHFSELWSPDGEHIAFAHPPGTILEKPSSGTGAEEPLIPDAQRRVPTDWSSDGRYLLFTAGTTGRADADIWVWRSGETKSTPFLTMPNANETAGRFSPDGRWVAYVSDESGRHEVYVVPFAPATGGSLGPARGKWQISTGGGTLPRWRRDGKEIFYYDERNLRIMAAAVSGAGAAFEIGAVQPLFPIRPVGGNINAGPIQRMFYDVSRDGQRFLVSPEPPERQSVALPATVVVNWLPKSSR
jgi:Tol biopolymer transport system component